MARTLPLNFQVPQNLEKIPLTVMKAVSVAKRERFWKQGPCQSSSIRKRLTNVGPIIKYSCNS